MKPARVWRSLPQRYRLEAAKCAACGKILFPPRPVCPACRGGDLAAYRLAETGKVVSYTVQHAAGDQFGDQTPFAVGIVELDDGVRITTQIVGLPPAEVRTGLRVRLVFRRIQEEGAHGVIAYGHKAEADEQR